MSSDVFEFFKLIISHAMKALEISDLEADIARTRKENVMDEFSPEQIVAIAGAIKGTREKAAKESLDEGSTATVDFIARFTGTVQKGESTPPGIATHIPVVSLNSVPVFCAVLRQLKIGSKRLAAALASIDPFPAADAELDDVFAHAAAEHAKKLPPVETTTPGRAANVTSQIHVSLM